jgi:hypothetical protein
MHGPEAVSEQALAERAMNVLPPGAALIADRNFGIFAIADAARQKGQDVVVRMPEQRAKRLVGDPISRPGAYTVEWKPSDHEQKYGLRPDQVLQGRLIAGRIGRGKSKHYVKPEDAGRKPYAFLYGAMREAGFAGVAQFAMHRRERVAILRPGPAGLLAHTMYFASEVRSDQEVRADTSLVTPKEVTLAKTLVNALAESFDPSKYRDTYRERLEALIAAKVEGRQTAVVTATPTPNPCPTLWRRSARVSKRSRSRWQRPKRPKAVR